MAVLRRLKKNTKSKMRNKEARNNASVSIGDLAEKNMKDYGEYTIKSRAIPMLYDGMKPVHRRVIFAMDKMGLRHNVAHRKAAKVYGDVIGNYHPHGDSAVYGAMVGLSTGNGTPMALIDGQGNWGNFDGNGPFRGAAAGRYTECRFTKFTSEVMVNKPYMDEEVIPYVPNYDGSTTEPMYLPSLLPTLFLLGAEGIATGVTVSMPSYTYDSVIAATKVLYATGNAKRAVKKLVPNQRWGAVLLGDQSAELAEYHKTGVGRLVWTAPYKMIDAKGATIFRLTGLPPIGYESFYNGLMKIKGVYSIVDLTNKKDGLLIEITVKDESAIPAVQKRMSSPESYKSAATIISDEKDADGINRVKFATWSPVEILEKWLEWRIDLEKRLIKSLIRDNDAEIARMQLMLLAANKLDIIFAILKAKSGDKVAMIQKQLKVSNEDAKTIWQMAVSRLDRINAEDTKATVTKLEIANKKLKKEYANPNDRIVAQLHGLSANLGDKASK